MGFELLLAFLRVGCLGPGVFATSEGLNIINNIGMIFNPSGHMCGSGAMCDELHVLMECSALADTRISFAQLIAECSGIMAKLVWV